MWSSLLIHYAFISGLFNNYTHVSKSKKKKKGKVHHLFNCAVVCCYSHSFFFNELSSVPALSAGQLTWCAFHRAKDCGSTKWKHSNNSGSGCRQMQQGVPLFFSEHLIWQLALSLANAMALPVCLWPGGLTAPKAKQMTLAQSPTLHANVHR